MTDTEKSAPDAEAGPQDRQNEAEKKDEYVPEFITGAPLLLAMMSVALVCFLVLLDTSIVSTAIPRITDEFYSLKDVGWYGSAYQLANAALQPVTGKLYTNFSSKWSFLGFFFVFELGSLLCGVATSSTMLIVARAVAGLGSAGLMNGGLTIIGSCVAPARRALWMGLTLGLAQLGVAVGPLIGGAFTTYSTWRWCFYLNLPVGALVAGFILFVRIPDQVPKPPALSVLPRLHRLLDLVGLALLAPAIIMLLLALEYGSSAGHDWSSATVVGLFCGFGATLLAWLAWDWRGGMDAMLPLPLLRRRIVWASGLALGFMMSAMLIASYFLPIYFQAVKGTSAMTSGVYLLPTILPQLLGSIVSGVLISKTGHPTLYLLVTGVTTAVASGLLATLEPDSSTGLWVGFQILAGGGRGLGFQMPFNIIQVLPPSQVAIAMAFLIFCQMLFSSVFLTVGNTVFNNRLAAELVAQAPGVDAADVLAAGATGFRDILAPEQLPGVVQAYSNALGYVFYIAAAVSVLCFISALCLGFGKSLASKEKPENEQGGEANGSGTVTPAEGLTVGEKSTD